MAARTEHEVLATELRWTIAVVGSVALISLAILWAGLVHFINPPSNLETIDPTKVHLSPEFTEANLGTRVDEGGRVTTRIVTAQFAFIPPCVVVPADEPVTLRLVSPDVIHGVLVTGTNVNTMVVPGYVSQVHTVFQKTGDLLMPCHEYCGIGHSQMWSTVRVVPKAEFKPGPDGRALCEKP